MNLYINTSDVYCELVLFKADQLVDLHKNDTPMAHSKVLHTQIDHLLKAQGLKLQDLSSIAVLNGPGSYTGLRVGLAAAKGFCYSLNIPLILFNKLNLLCNNYLTYNTQAACIACIEPARQDEYFFTLIDRVGSNETANVRHIDHITKLINTLPEVKLISSKLDFVQQINAKIEKMELSMNYLANTIQESIKKKEFADIFQAEPFYLKKVYINKAKKRF